MEAPVREPKEPKAPNEPTVEELHLLIENLGDEITSYRKREAVWLSLVAHAVVILFLIFAPNWMPGGPRVVGLQPQKQDTVFLTAPKTRPTVKPPKSDVISDQNRLAQSRLPSKETLRKLLDSRRPGPPAQPQAPPTPQQQAQQQPASGAQQAQSEAPKQQQPAQQTAQVQPAQPKRNPFAMASPGAAVNQAIQQAGSDRGATRSFGGDSGAGPLHAKAERLGSVEILSDTMGVDFGPYLQRLHFVVQSRWDVLIPQVALPPVMKKGVVVLEFAILPDGRVQGLKVVGSSGDESLDRAAFGSISNGALPQLPPEYKGKYLLMRARYYYNPDKGDFE
jgi:TonB family protein